MCISIVGCKLYSMETRVGTHKLLTLYCTRLNIIFFFHAAYNRKLTKLLFLIFIAQNRMYVLLLMIFFSSAFRRQVHSFTIHSVNYVQNILYLILFIILQIDDFILAPLPPPPDLKFSYGLGRTY